MLCGGVICSMNNINLNKKHILDIIFKHVPKNDCVVFLFGSFANGEIYPSSDIDLGIICNVAVDNRTIVQIKEEFEKIETLRDIDLVDFTSIQDKDFLKIALKEVEIWHQTEKSRAYLDNLRKLIAG
jgi:predicted nucleotidyltransferase